MRGARFGWDALAVMGGAPIYAIATALPPSFVQHTRPVFAHLSQRLEAHDRIYVYSGAGLAYSYYGPRFEIPREAVTLGRCSVADPREYFRELDRLRGEKRVWFIATHEQRIGEMELILGYLDQVGQRLDALIVPASNGRVIETAYGYLYDLSDRDRLGSASAETYALPAALKPLPIDAQRWGCYGITGGEPLRSP